MLVFPAAEARQRNGWDSVALLDCQQMAVQGDLCRCIRVLAHVLLPTEQTPSTPIWVKPVDCVRTDLVTTDSSAAGPGTAPPAMGLRRIPITE